MSELRATPRSVALAAAMQAGAAAADAVAVESDSLEARVRGEEIDFVKQARERKLGVRALVRGARGTRSAITSTSDLSEPARARGRRRTRSRWRAPPPRIRPPACPRAASPTPPPCPTSRSPIPPIAACAPRR